MSLEAHVKTELEDDCHHVHVKKEADLNNEADWLKVEFEDVTQEPTSVKQEEGWGDGAALHVGHQLKEEVVLGTESLQPTDIALVYGTSLGRARARFCSRSRVARDAPRFRAARDAPRFRAARDTGVGAGAVGAVAEQKTAPLKINTETHRNYVEINTYMCDICGKLFMAKNNLIRHIKVHLRNNTDKRVYMTEKQYSCKLCNKTFKQSGHRNRHVRRAHAHAAPPCVVCKICQKGFTRLESLRLHKLIHTGQKPYSCEICDKKFTQIGNLTRHTRIHTGEKPHACAVCSRRFTQSCDLKKHLRIHTRDKPYTCQACGCQFTCSGDLRKHKRTAGHKRTLNLQKNNCTR